MTDRKNKARLYWWVGSVAIICILSFRGQHLLGRPTGILFAMISFAIALIGYRNLCVPTPSRTGSVLFTIFAAACAAIMFTPATFSPKLQHFINKQAADRNARAELKSMIQANSEYSEIKIETQHLKVVFVSINGTVPNRRAIDRLLADLSRLEFLRYCSLHGRVIIRDTGVVHEFTDNDLEFDTDKIAGNHVVNRSDRQRVY